MNITLPFTDEIINQLKCGDRVLLSGTVYTARDAAHKRMAEKLAAGEPLPFDLMGQTIYYAGPCPAKPGHAIGSCGPTTSGRMDAYTPALLDLGLKAMIGKGQRSDDVIRAIVRNHCVYLGATGGAGALYSKCITEMEVIAYEDLGPESVKRLTVKDMPLTVIIDASGRSLYDSENQTT